APLTTALNVLGGGTFAPGAPGTPGTAMAITGSLAFQAGAFYMVQINPSASSNASVSGSASLNGTVDAVFATGAYTPRSGAAGYDILHSGSLGGTKFAGITTSNLPAGFTPSLFYTTTDVYLDLSANLGGGGAPLNANEQAVANAIDNFFNNVGTLPPNFVTIFGLTGAQLQQALSELDGEAATGAATSTFQLVNDFFDLLSDMALGTGGGGGAGGGTTGFAATPDDAFPPDLALAYAKALKKNAAQSA